MSASSDVRRFLPFPTTDLWGGLAAMLVALPSSIAFGVLVYSSIDPGLAGQGALFGMLGAAALGLVAPFVGRTPALITAPCAPSAAVLAGLATALLAAEVETARIPGLLALTALMSALLQVLYGAVRGGRFIKYIPYPVVSGYLSGVGLIIALGQLPKLLGLPADISLLDGVIDPAVWQWPGIVVGLVTILAMVFAPRLTDKVPAAIIGLVSGMIAYFVAGLFMPEMLVVDNNPLIIGTIEASGSFVSSVEGQFSAVLDISLADVSLIWTTALALSALLCIDTLKTCVVLDALTGGRHNSNRELTGQGVANLASFAVGGMAGAGTMGPTLVNVTSGGTTRWSGTAEGIFVVLAVLALSPLIAWVPIGALAGILLVVAYRMIDWPALKLMKFRETRLDFVVIAAVVVVAVGVGLIQASITGVVLAIILFIRDQVRGSVIRKKASLNEISSKTQRLEEERNILNDNGHLASSVELQANLFFGTTDQLYAELETELNRNHWLLLDMRRVQSMDYTAANLLRQMHRRLAERNGCLLLCGMPSNLPEGMDINRYLEKVGLTGQEGLIKVFETRDEALEWMENSVLALRDWESDDDRPPLDLGEIELLSELDEDTIDRLRTCTHELNITAGGSVFRKGDTGDEIYLIRRGEVRILLPLVGEQKHHVATFHRGDFFGEMAFLDYETRSADAEAKTDCRLYWLSRKEFDQHAASDPLLGMQTFTRLARAVSLRLRQTNSELRALEER
jgi:SulP family sulfate permease